jgi:ATP-dependent RNA helicase RhlE
MQNPDEPSDKPRSNPANAPASDTEVERIVPVERFEDLAVEPVVLRGLEHFGYATPTPIQKVAIPALAAGRDLIGLAPTGTGKTLAYGIPLAHQLIVDPPPLTRRARKGKGGDKGGKFVDPKRRLRGLVVVPTRELASQVAEEIRRLTKGSLVKVGAVWGKAAIKPQREKIEAGLDILVGTPGRLRELMDIDVLSLAFIRHLVIDEGDRMLDMGFLPQIRTILERMPEQRQMAFFSATMPPAMEDLARTFLQRPARVEVGRHTRAAEHLGNRLYEIEDVLKVALLLQLVVGEQRRGVLVFCRTRRRAGWVHAALRHHGISVGLVHGDRSQNQRTRALEQFAEGASAVLVATDVAARGLHIDRVRTVINYDLPLSAEEWVHRIGRAGHGGGFGESFTFVAPPERSRWKQISKIVDERIRADPLPDFDEFVRPQDREKLEKFRSGRKSARLEPFREGGDRDRQPRGGRSGKSDKPEQRGRRTDRTDRSSTGGKPLAVELDEWGIELSPDEIESFEPVSGGKGTKGGSRDKSDRKPAGKSSSAAGKSGAKKKKFKPRGGDRITHGGRRSGARKPVDPKQKPGGGVRRPS